MSDASGDSGPYVTTKSSRFYPGSLMSDERKRQLADLEISAAEVTYDDILVNTAAAYTGTFYAVMALITERWGAEAAEEVARALGYRNGKANLVKWMSNHGVTEGSAELMAKYEDLAHALRGPNHANAVSEYDEHRCVVTRRRCGWHTGRPEGAPSYCRHFSESAIRGYFEADPAIEEARTYACMSYGDDHCHHEFWYSKPNDQAPAGLRDVYRRGDAGAAGADIREP